MSWFSRKPEPEQATPTDVEVIRTKLAECAAQIEAAERDRDQASLSIALSADENAGKDVLARLAELQGKRELLTAALRQAEQQEREEQGRLNAREWLARKRSLAQRTGTLIRDQEAVSKALGDLRDSFRAMIRTAQSIHSLLPPALRDDEGWQNSLSGKYIRRLIEVESWRISQDGPLNPGASQRPVYADEIPSMASTIGTVCENLKISFDGCGPSPVPSPVVVVSPTEQSETEAAAPLVMPKPESKSEPEPANSEPEPAARTVLPVIDLRGMDLGVPKSGEPDIWVKEEVAA